MHALDLSLHHARGLIEGGSEVGNLLLELMHAIFKREHVLDALEREAKARCELGDALQAHQFGIRVEAGAAGSAARSDQTSGFIQPQRLGVHADEVGGDARLQFAIGLALGGDQGGIDQRLLLARQRLEAVLDTEQRVLGDAAVLGALGREASRVPLEATETLQ
jgi:hypothetical protein